MQSVLNIGGFQNLTSLTLRVRFDILSSFFPSCKHQFVEVIQFRRKTNFVVSLITKWRILCKTIVKYNSQLELGNLI